MRRQRLGDLLMLMNVAVRCPYELAWMMGLISKNCHSVLSRQYHRYRITRLRHQIQSNMTVRSSATRLKSNKSESHTIMPCTSDTFDTFLLEQMTLEVQ